MLAELDHLAGGDFQALSPREQSTVIRKLVFRVRRFEPPSANANGGG
jgi:hypothetical protein